MNTKTKHALIVSSQILLWTAANFSYAFDTQILYHRFTYPAVIIDLFLLQVLLGLFVPLFINVSRNEFSDMDIPILPESYSISSITLSPTFFHLTATLLTNLSYRAIGLGPTLVCKLTEPLFALFLKPCILHESTNVLSAIGVIFLIAGVLTYSVKSSATFTFAPILLANMLYPARNAFLKLDQKKSSNQHVNPEQRLFVINRMCFPFSLGMFLIRLWFSHPDPESIPFLIRTALLFNVYQYTSIFLLDRFDPVTHSVANTVKRFSTILLSSIVIRQSITETRIFGLLLTAIGVPLYFQGETIWKGRRIGKQTLRVSFIAVFLLVWTVSPLLSQQTPEDLLPGSDLKART